MKSVTSRSDHFLITFYKITDNGTNIMYVLTDVKWLLDDKKFGCFQLNIYTKKIKIT